MDRRKQEEMQEFIERDTRRYARHQEVWFRKWEFASELSQTEVRNTQIMLQELQHEF